MIDPRRCLRRAAGAAIILIGVAVACGARADAPQHPGWLIDPQTHCRVWDNNIEPDERVQWKGACKNGVAEGPGVLRWMSEKTDETIEGILVAGRIEGRALVTTAIDSRIEAEFHDSMLEGVAVVTQIDGTKTTMHYHEDKQVGRVQVVWPNGEKLDGDLDAQGKIHGIRTWPNGSKYEGDFNPFFGPEGKGSFIRADGLRYKGDFVRGQMEGEGEMLFSDGGIHQGSFRNGKPNGYGTSRAANGDIFRGVWVDGCLSPANSTDGSRAASGRSLESCGFN